MPKIYLKPNSAEFANHKDEPYTAKCDMPGCECPGEHKAPKDRGLKEYYWFCTEHIREYNKAWNFFEGMSSQDVEDHLLKSMYGDRPTWKYGVNGDAEEALYTKAWETYSGDEEPPKREERRRAPEDTHNTPEYEAMALMGLEPPVTLDAIKIRYKELAKKHHPDLNKGCAKSEELLKQINMAYTILKLAYEKFDELEKP